VRRWFYIGILVVLYSPLSAQEERYSLKLEEVLFKDFVDSLEEKVMCKVYYAEDWVDSFYVSVNARNEVLEQLISHALAGSGFTFMVTGRNQVILSQGHVFKTDFREAYNRHLTQRMARVDTAIYSIQGQQEDQENSISEEFRLYKIGNPAEMERPGRVEL